LPGAPTLEGLREVSRHEERAASTHEERAASRHEERAAAQMFAREAGGVGVSCYWEEVTH
jgi:hypothetical protein